MVRVIATDLDGTLLKPERKFTLVDKEYKKFIKRFYGDIVLNSGRTPRFCAKICNKLKIEHNFIALNGAVIVKNGNVIYNQSIKKTVLNNLLELLEEYYDDFEFIIFDKYDTLTCFSPKKETQVKRKYFRYHLKNGKLCEKIKVSNKKVKQYLQDNTVVYKALIYSKNIDDMGNLLKQKFKDHFELYIGDHSIEISPIGTNKGSALKYLIDTTTVKKDEVFVVGDGVNDIPMFELYPNSFLINSDNTHLKLNVKYVIDKFSDLEEYTKLNDNFH